MTTSGGRALLGVILAAACAMPAVAISRNDRAQTLGYLSGGGAPDTIQVMPPPPANGTDGDAHDRAVYDQTRKLRHTDRWDLAVSDADLSLPSLLADFSCALTFLPAVDRTPRLVELIRRAAIDGGAASQQGKQFYKRPRPYVAYGSSDICVPDSPDLRTSFDYPSGHAAIGFTVALVLTEVEPDRASKILARGRSFGESRVVCGVHTASAVEASRTAAAAFFAVMQSNAAFRADVAAARHEIDGTGAAPATLAMPARTCMSANSVGATTPWDQKR